MIRFDFLRDITIQIPTGEVVLKASKINAGYRFDIYCKGTVGDVEILKFERPEKLYVNNWQSWGPAKVIDKDYSYKFPVELREKFGYSASIMPEIAFDNLVSDYLIGSHDGVIGFLTSKTAHPYFKVGKENVELHVNFFDTRFDNWQITESFVLLNLPFDYALKYYSELVAEENKVRFEREKQIGWCSWYQYFTNFTFDEMIKNLDLAKDKGYNVFQIDDSWQVDIGDWYANDEFKSTKLIADEIKKRGFRAGIWLAPFSVSEKSKLFKEHPDWLVKNEDGTPKVAYQNWDKNIYALDTTHPEALNWLKELFISLKKDGFEYFKIDFLFAGAIPGKRYESVSPITAYRKGLRLIREITSDNFLLGCGAPLLPSVGLVDGMRIGPDTAPYWDKNGPDIGYPNAFYALRNTVTRWYMTNWWQNDPDCLLLRRENTQLSDEHRRVFTYVTIALDNMVLQSDNLSLNIDWELWNGALQSGEKKFFVSNLMNNTPIIESGGMGEYLKISLDFNTDSYEILHQFSHRKIEKIIERREDGRTFNYYNEWSDENDREKI